ncbi:glycine zipper 2TM domain-containing protein [Silvimonas soli]|uniref:glycine zipper 2TM domain-containing protein n=1 Tax=Silvimonas soli TaxID=2980100 RepID=UPI0024B36901|nr:glycine zipper 2TM domain-containing protein [Silvimonas soli]
MSEQQKLHPLILTAAGAVVIACGVAVAHMAGWIGAPKTDAEQLAASVPAVVAVASAPEASIPAQLVATQVPAVAPVAEATPHPKPKHSTNQRATSNNQGQEYASNQAQPAKQVCAVCGRVASVQTVTQEGKSSGGGAVAGGVVGGLLGNQVGNGRGRTVATVVGAVGGALAGNTVEKHVRTETDYQVHVQFDDGNSRTYTYKEKPAFVAGDRVRASGETLVLDQ